MRLAPIGLGVGKASRVRIDGPAMRNKELSLNTEVNEVHDLADEARGSAAFAAWVERGAATPLERWLDRLLDPEGTPRRLPVGTWVALLARLDEARRLREEGWTDRLDARIEGLFRATLRFARTDGRAVFTAAGGPARPDLPALFRGWAERLTDPGLGTVVNWWFPPLSRERS